MNVGEIGSVVKTRLRRRIISPDRITGVDWQWWRVRVPNTSSEWCTRACHNLYVFLVSAAVVRAVKLL
jgi:hypothetical protein